MSIGAMSAIELPRMNLSRMNLLHGRRELEEDLAGGLDLFQVDPLVASVRLIDVAWSEDDGGDARFREGRCIGAVRHGQDAVGAAAWSMNVPNSSTSAAEPRGERAGQLSHGSAHVKSMPSGA